jgi:4'-phosphopantetheinyl transferase
MEGKGRNKITMEQNNKNIKTLFNSNFQMSVIPSDKCIKCVFAPNANKASDSDIGELDVFYGITKDFYSEYTDLENYITRDEKSRADRFHFIDDRNTFISCHSLLRSVLSKKLRKNPLEIDIHYDKNNKPGLSGDPLYFNITHSRGAFAFVISSCYYAGIDMENTNRSIDFFPIINSFLSDKERKYILDSNGNTYENFYQIWTRKEALLKAIGTGLTVDMAQFEVSEKENNIYSKSFDNNMDQSVCNEHFIYTAKVSEYYLSIAIPQKAEINLHKINKENIISYLS